MANRDSNCFRTVPAQCILRLILSSSLIAGYSTSDPQLEALLAFKDSITKDPVRDLEKQSTVHLFLGPESPAILPPLLSFQ